MFGYLYTLMLGGGNSVCVFGVFFDLVFGFLSTHFGRGKSWVPFLNSLSSVFGYLYTLVLGGWNYGHFFGRFFSIRYLDIFTH